MATGDALQSIARAGWRVAAYNHADDFWKKTAENKMPYQFGHVVLETKDGKIIRSHKGISPPAFITGWPYCKTEGSTGVLCETGKLSNCSSQGITFSPGPLINFQNPSFLAICAIHHMKLRSFARISSQSKII